MAVAILSFGCCRVGLVGALIGTVLVFAVPAPRVRCLGSGGFFLAMDDGFRSTTRPFREANRLGFIEKTAHEATIITLTATRQ
jgi:hypothetical protein